LLVGLDDLKANRWREAGRRAKLPAKPDGCMDFCVQYLAKELRCVGVDVEMEELARVEFHRGSDHIFCLTSRVAGQKGEIESPHRQLGART